MSRKQLPIGLHDFSELIRKNYYFVDKSLLIKDIIDSGAVVTLFPRPRRFGKTLNMSMIRCFFEKTEHSKLDLFNNLKITEHPTCMAHQGQYPVIFMTFKGVKELTWEACLNGIRNVIADEYRRHDYLLTSTKLDGTQKEEFQAIINKKADTGSYQFALQYLSQYLHKFHGKRAIILIDEYDIPINSAYDHDYYQDMINFMRNFLTGGFKDNSNLEFGILTGILRVAKESIFSGLNNLEVNTLFNKSYSDKFGLLESEVNELLAYFNRPGDIDQVRDWYDGYQSGEYKLYNPWSIINFAKTGEFKTYWANTSENALLKKVLQYGPENIKEDCEKILQGVPITKEIDENVVMSELFTSERAAWSLLLMSGYLTFEKYGPQKRLDLPWVADLKIPNAEVATIYNTQILSWFEVTGSAAKYNSMLQSLMTGKTDDFREQFDIFTTQTLSVFDASGKNPEKFYHGLVLGMLASLRDTHEVVSNRESGFGRYDVSIFPRDTTKPGIIIEFKVASKLNKETLPIAAKKALEQIEDRNYAAAMRARGIKQVIKIGIAFKGKKNLVVIG